MSDQLKAILDTTPTSDRLRATAWDLFYQTQSPEELQSALSGVGFNGESLARMVQLKMGDQGPSALSRFASNAAEVLNPIEAVKGLATAIRHPIDTATNVMAMHGEQARKSGEAFREGRYSEAAGHGLATVTPLIGPIAAEAGEQIAAGDAAGGLGTAAGLLAPVGVAGAVRSGSQAMRAVPSGARARVASALESGATERVADVMSPKVGANKTRFGNQAAKVAPRVAQDMAQNGAPWTREGLHAQVGERLAAAERALDDAANARNPNQVVHTAPVVRALRQKRAELTSQTHRIGTFKAGEDVVPAPNAARVAEIDRAIAEVETLGPVANYEALRRIRQAYDGPAKAVYSQSMTADYLKAQGGKLGAADVTGVLRETLAQMDPQTAAANADYHVYRTANDVLEATKEVERTRPRVGRAIIARVTGAILGQEAAGTGGAVAGYLGAPIVDSMLSSGGTTKLKTANIMSKLANAIRRGDVQSVDALTTQLTRLRRAGAVQQANERATSPSESRMRTAPATP